MAISFVSLINRLDEGALESLSERSRSAPSGQSSSSSWLREPAAKLDLSSGVNRERSAFLGSAQRLGPAVNSFQQVSSALTELSDLARRMAKTASAAEKASSSATRGKLQTEFESEARQFRKTLDSLKSDDTNLLEKGDLSKVLEEAGVDLSDTTALAQAFADLGQGDGKVGYSEVPGGQTTYIDQARGGQARVARAPQDPLDNDLRTRGGAKVAADQLQRLVDDIGEDAKDVATILGNLQTAQNFALAGYRATSAAAEQVTNYGSASDLAALIANSIRSASGGTAQDAHNIDQKLAQDLLK